MAHAASPFLLIREAAGVLRGEGRYATGRLTVPWAALACLVAVGGLLYGGAMGAFGLRPLQSIYSATKVPLLLFLAPLVCLPNFYVVNALLGLRDDFPAACRGVFAGQATVAITLAALSPITLMVYGSTADYNSAVQANGAAFFVAAMAGQATLRRHYRALIASNPRHKIGRTAWLVLYVFVAIQLAWVLRPFVGSPNVKTRFFRENAWSNAYMVVIEEAARAFGHEYGTQERRPR